MRERFSLYINEVVSLVIMLLMAFALIAGQAAGSPEPESAAEAARYGSSHSPNDSSTPVKATTKVTSSRRW